MSGVTKTSLMSPSPESYVSSAVATIGVQNETYGCIAHAIQVSCVCVCVITDDGDYACIIFHTQHYFSYSMGQRLYTNMVFKALLGKKNQWMKERGIRKSD